MKLEELLHRFLVDMEGSPPVSVCGCRYHVTVTDEEGGMLAMGPIRNKTDASNVVVGVIILWDTQVQAPHASCEI